MSTIEDRGTRRVSANIGGDAIRYEQQLLELGSRHHLVIYNRMEQWPDSGALTYFPLAKELVQLNM